MDVRCEKDESRTLWCGTWASALSIISQNQQKNPLFLFLIWIYFDYWSWAFFTFIGHFYFLVWIIFSCICLDGIYKILSSLSFYFTIFWFASYLSDLNLTSFLLKDSLNFTNLLSWVFLKISSLLLFLLYILSANSPSYSYDFNYYSDQRHTNIYLQTSSSDL